MLARVRSGSLLPWCMDENGTCCIFCFIASSSFPKKGGRSLIWCLLLFWRSDAMLFATIEQTDLLDIPNNSSLPASAPSSKPSRCPGSPQVQHTHLLLCGSSHCSEHGMAQLQSAAFPSQIAELSHGSAPLSLSNHVRDRTNDGLSQTSNRSPLLCCQPQWSCPSNKSASPRGLSGDPLLSCCQHDG